MHTMTRDTQLGTSAATLSLTLVLTLILGGSASAAPMPQSLDLSQLNGANGFLINGAGEIDTLGTSVSNAGDVNNDGVDDLIIGASVRTFTTGFSLTPSTTQITAKAAIIFGGQPLSQSLGQTSSVDIASLDGSNGFIIQEIEAVTSLGGSVSAAGDLNDDGIDDLIIGATGADPGGRSFAGEVYVLFGASDIGAGGFVSTSDLNGSNGFVFNGINRGDRAGSSVSGVGDINGDGVDDVVIGAFAADPGGVNAAGEIYAVFGRRNLGASGSIELSQLAAGDGVVINGIAQTDVAGGSVSSAGDINADGLNDLLIGASQADPNGLSFAGQAYVVFGAANLGTTGTIALDGLDGNDGFTINGTNQTDRLGNSVSPAGDFNGDGVDDLIIGASMSGIEFFSGAGKSHMIFGAQGIGSSGTLDLSALNGSNGFVIEGITLGDTVGRSVSNAGDVNGDGSSDIIIGAGGVDSDGESDTGQSYIVFGGSTVGNSGTLNLSTLNGRNGVALNGINGGDFSGLSVSAAGDLNDDGVGDVVIGAPGANRSPADTIRGAGESYVVFMPLPDDSDSRIEPFNLSLGETRFLSFHPTDRLDSFGLSLSSESIVLIETANDGTALDYDTSLIITSVTTGFEEVVANNDDIEPGINEYSRITQTLAAGEYFVSVTSLQAGIGPVTIPSYALSVTVLEPCDVSDPALQKTLGNGDFELLSLPCQPPAGTTINDLFNDDIEGEYFDGNSGTWVVFTWNPEAFEYVNPGPNGTLEPGQGFWISQAQANGQDAVLDLPEGSVTTRSTGTAASACASDTGCLSIELSDIEFPINPNTNAPVLTLPNLIGNPYDQPVTPFDDVQVTTTNGVCSIKGGGCSPTEATLPADGGANVLGNVAFTFNPQLRDGLGDYEQVVSGSVLEPWQAFWVFQLPAGIDNNPVVRFPDLR